MYILNLPSLPQLDLCLLGLVHGYFKDFPTHLAVLTELGQVANTAFNEPASLLGTKQLLLLDQSRRK